MNDRFKMSGTQMRNFAILFAAGLIFCVGGFFLSTRTDDSHGAAHDTHHEAAPAGHGNATKGDKMVMLASGDHRLYAQAHDDHAADTSTATTAEPAHADTSVHAAGEAHGEDHHGGDGHDEAGSSAGHELFGHGVDTDTRSPGGTWNRAPLQPVHAHAAEHHAPSALGRIGSVLLMAAFWFIGIGLMGIFFQAFSILANAGWFVAFRRIPEVFYMFIPIGMVLLVIVFFLREHVYEWAQPGIAGHDALIAKKTAFLNSKWLIGTFIALPVIWTLFGHLLRTASVKEDTEGGLTQWNKSFKIAAGFLPIFGVSWCIAAFLWMMSLEPHWFSTIYAVYCFATVFVSAVTIMTLIVCNLMEKGYLPNVNEHHLHDLGKFMFAFSIFWTYIWLSQFLLIWYANIPEETIYYVKRFENYFFLFAANVVINFVLPFLWLMTKNSKKNFLSLRTIGAVILFGRFIDIFLLVAPGTLGAHWNMGSLIMAAGGFMMVGAIFLFIVYKGIEMASLAPKNHPYWQETTHHSTGV